MFRDVRAVGTEGLGERGGVHGPQPDFDRSSNPISTRGADYALHINTFPPGFQDIPTALDVVWRHLHLKISMLSSNEMFTLQEVKVRQSQKHFSCLHIFQIEKENTTLPDSVPDGLK